MTRGSDLDAIIAAQPQPYKNGRWKIDPRLAMSFLGWFIGSIVTVMLAWGAFNARVTVLEAQRQEDLRRLLRLEDKVDILLRRP